MGDGGGGLGWIARNNVLPPSRDAWASYFLKDHALLTAHLDRLRQHRPYTCPPRPLAAAANKPVYAWSRNSPYTGPPTRGIYATGTPPAPQLPLASTYLHHRKHPRRDNQELASRRAPSAELGYFGTSADLCFFQGGLPVRNRPPKPRIPLGATRSSPSLASPPCSRTLEPPSALPTTPLRPTPGPDPRSAQPRKRARASPCRPNVA